ncbi:MAG: DUF4136 domain-containing protein [Deltaproteobacteria bacterium]|nr:DUF4136 domain-containing protein [Deltaproteobacteria bacterium]MBI2180187.1 DUF4136 domain-containing protein [Deltaproteobacteria bacterium]MBI2231123.1 DUF4136 domain-containing protein [Deltaproteobacteria bacterium]MBI2367626.1 DUF4136 domain-containing protein [Deltaproteobacteria bacterium]MBI2535253.1 DUF4136 domain-containing protein [Deltaproteobacteria bacterium]
MKTSLLGMVGIVSVTLTLGACSTATPIVSEWRNPAYALGPFKRIMVGGLSRETSVRRNFEDEFVVQLRAAGIDALASYRYIPQDEGVDENNLKQAAQKARADAVLFARSLKTEQKTNYGPTFPYLSFGIFGSNVGASWSGLSGAPGAYRYNEYTSETTLYDVAKNEVVWTGTVKTTEPENEQTAIKSYVEAVMKALDAQNLLPGR